LFSPLSRMYNTEEDILFIFGKKVLSMEKKHYTPEERAELAEKAAANAGEHFRHGLNCGECVLKGFLDLGLTDFPPEIVALASGMGGGMGGTGRMCGAVNAGMLVISSMHGRRNPYAKETMDERIEELHHPETGVYPRHAAYLRAVIREIGALDCRDLCLPYEDFESRDRKRNCKKIIMTCARIAAEMALRD
jgi:C_GCAxxG_C_C family probable redox protein